MSAAVVADVVVVRYDGDIGWLPLIVPDEPDDLVVAAMGGRGEDASDPGQALIAASRELFVAVENDDALAPRVIMAPCRDLKGEPASRVFQAALKTGLQYRDAVDDVVAVDEEDLRYGLART